MDASDLIKKIQQRATYTGFLQTVQANPTYTVVTTSCESVLSTALTNITYPSYELKYDVLQGRAYCDPCAALSTSCGLYRT